MPVYKEVCKSCEVGSLESSPTCAKGIVKAAYICRDDIEWETMERDPALFNQERNQFRGFALATGKVFAASLFRAKDSTLTETYANDTGEWTATATEVFHNATERQKDAIAKIAGKCVPLLKVFWLDGCPDQAVVVGVYWDKEEKTFYSYDEPFRLTSAELNYGQKGSDNKRQSTLTFEGNAPYPSLSFVGTYADFKTAFM